MRFFSALGSTWFLILLALSAAITLFASSFISVAMITIIGIPIAIYLMLAPTLFLVFFGAWVFARALGGGFLSRVAGAATALALLAVPPLLANSQLDTSVRNLVENDHDDATRPEARVIAFRVAKLAGRTPAQAPCDGLCQRMLLNGAADRILYVNEDINQPPSPETLATSYRMERRGTCPEIELPRAIEPTSLASERRDRNAKRADELMTIEIARGNCLVVEQAPLAEAGLIISSGSIKRGTNITSAGLNPFADTVSAERISMHERKGSSFAETFRQTSTTVRKLWHLYMPSATSSADFRMYPALVRTGETMGGEIDLADFLIERLGFDLALRQADAEADTRKLLAEALAGNATDAPSALAQDFFEGIGRARIIAADDLEMARRLLSDPRFAVPNNGSAAVIHAKDAPDSYFSAIGDAMFARLRRIPQTDTGEDRPEWAEEARRIARIVTRLPRDAILEHRADLEWLARQERLRVEAWSALIRLSEFGAESAQTLLWLIDDSWRFRDEKGKSTNTWQHPYLAGVIGLCRTGPSASEAIRPFLDRMASGKIVQFGSYWDLNINTLISLGADIEDIRPVFELDDGNRSGERFEDEAKRAAKKLDCSY